MLKENNSELIQKIQDLPAFTGEKLPAVYQSTKSRFIIEFCYNGFNEIYIIKISNKRDVVSRVYF